MDGSSVNEIADRTKFKLSKIAYSQVAGSEFMSRTSFVWILARRQYSRTCKLAKSTRNPTFGGGPLESTRAIKFVLQH